MFGLLLPMAGLITLPRRTLHHSIRRMWLFLCHPILSVCHPELVAPSLVVARWHEVAALRGARRYRLIPRAGFA